MILTADDVKQHLRIEDDEEDGYIESLIQQAQAVAEDFCRTEFGDDAPQPVRLALCSWFLITMKTVTTLIARSM